MPAATVLVRFVGMLPSQHAEAVAREGVHALQALAAQVKRWDVCMRPPLPCSPLTGYAVRVQARMDDGSTLAIRSQSGGLVQAVREAFEGVAELLEQEYGGAGDGAPGWRPARAGEPPALPA